jgi:uncharacterized protein with HEPN domain
MRLQEIGENLARIRRLDDPWLSERAPASWSELIGLRHVISHEYEAIELTLIWQIVSDELPLFAVSIDAVSEEFP